MLLYIYTHECKCLILILYLEVGWLSSVGVKAVRARSSDSDMYSRVLSGEYRFGNDHTPHCTIYVFVCTELHSF